MFNKEIICFFCLFSQSLAIRQEFNHNKLYWASEEIYEKPEPHLIVSKVRNGEVAGDLQVPYQAAILDKNGNNYAFCGGSLISRHYVLTAAHCFIHNDEIVKTQNDIYIILGHADLNDNERYYVSKIVTHPDYYVDSEFNNHNDLALLRLHKRVKTSIKAVCLPKDDKNKFAGVSLKISGWGIYNTQGQLSEKLRIGHVVGLKETTCANVYNGVNSKHLCVVSGTQDFCKGDSGGPVVADVGGKNVLVGIMSYGQECSIPRVAPGVAVRVSSYLSWIIANSDYRRC